MGSEIKDALKELMKDGEPRLVTFTASIKSVDWDKRQCTVIDAEGREFEGVRLRAIIDNAKTGLCIKPTVDSTVLVGVVDGQELDTYISQYTEIDELSLQMQDVDLVIDNTGKVKLKVKQLDIDANQTTFNGGNLGGLVDVIKLTAKFNAFVAAFNTHTHSVSGSATLVPASAAGTISQSDIENPKIKQ